MFLVLTPGGQQMLVDSLDGHEDCTVLDANAAPMVLADAKALKRGEVDALLVGQFLGGFTPSTGPISGKTLQFRDSADRTNWLASHAAYSAQVSAGNGAGTGATFRTADNSTVTCSYSDGLNALLAMAAWEASLRSKSWALKDAIDAMTDANAVLAYDVAAQWGET